MCNDGEKPVVKLVVWRLDVVDLPHGCNKEFLYVVADFEVEVIVGAQYFVSFETYLMGYYFTLGVFDGNNRIFKKFIHR